jgi:3-oxoacyl-[acyl-carrier-protein] synthase-1
LTKAILSVTEGFDKPDGPRIDDIIGDMNGEPYRADEYAFAIVRTSRRFVDAGTFQAPADCWGDVGAASGPLFAVLATAAASRGYARGPHTLLWTSSESGERTALVLYSECQPRE